MKIEEKKQKVAEAITKLEKLKEKNADLLRKYDAALFKFNLDADTSHEFLREAQDIQRETLQVVKELNSLYHEEDSRY